MENRKLRKADFYTSIILFALGLFMLVQTFSIPMTDSYAGVTNAWYISPALFPLFICPAIMLLAVLIFLRAVKEEGFANLIHLKTRKSQEEVNQYIRGFAVGFMIISHVYVFLPRTDFLLSTCFNLMIMMSAFYLEQMSLLIKISVYYLLASLLVIVFALMKASIPMVTNEDFVFLMDIYLLISITAFLLFCSRLVTTNLQLKRKLKQVIILSITLPVILCPIIKYFFLIPLPVEGIILEKMDNIRYCQQDESWIECLNY